MLEKYRGADTNYSIFLRESLFPVCFKKAKTVCLYTNEKMYISISEKFRECDTILEFNSPTNNKKHSGKTNLIYC